MKNNDELLKRRLEQLVERDFNLKKREFLLSKLKSNEFKLGSCLNPLNQTKTSINNELNQRSSDKNINEGNNFIK